MIPDALIVIGFVLFLLIFFGVFIIEVKNYSGDLIGEEEDAEWIKIHNPSWNKTARWKAR